MNTAAGGIEAPRGLKPALLLIAVMSVVAVYGFVREGLFGQELWKYGGLERWGLFSAVYWAAAGLLVLVAPRWLMPAAVVFVFGYSEWWCWEFFDPWAPVAVVYFLGSCYFAGRWMARGVMAVLVGLAAWVFALSIAVHFGVNRPGVYWAGFGAPYVAGAGLRGRIRNAVDDHRVSMRGVERKRANAAGLAVLIYVLMMQWIVALKPEVSADGLAMHLAIPEMIAREHRFAFDFQHYAWSLMPMGGDFAFTAVYLLGGEIAAKLLNFAMLAVIAALVYRAARGWLEPGRAGAATALFASAPLAQLVTGSLFVENVWAAFLAGGAIAVWEGEAICAGILIGAALATKVGTSAFLVPMAIAAAAAMRKRAWAAAALMVVFASPPYLNAWVKTGNPIFPFSNNVFHSKYFDSSTALADMRYQQKASWDELYRLAFRSQEFFEGQKGALGFQYFVLLPPLLLLLSRKAPRAPVLIGVAGAVLTLASIPNLRYLYPAMPLVSIGIAWMMAEMPWTIAAAAVLTGLNLWFLPAAGWYQQDFAAYGREDLEAFVKRAAPERKLIELVNEIAPGQPIAVFHAGAIAGLHAKAYVDDWHTYRFYRGLMEAADAKQIAEMTRSLGIHYLITPIPPETSLVVVEQFLETWTAPTAKESGKYQLRTLLDVPVAKPRVTDPAGAGSYDDGDSRIEYTGTWLHDQQFEEPFGKSITYSNTPGDRAAFLFHGTSIEYVYTMAFNRGIVEISIDREARGRIDLYSKEVKWQQRRVFGGLERGPHTIELRVAGEKNPRSSGTFVDLDRFVVR